MPAASSRAAAVCVATKVLLRAAAPPLLRLPAMGGDHGDHIHYEEVALDEMEWVEEDGMYYYQCPCGDMFEISQEDIEEGEDVARCPSCSLTLKVIMPAAAGKDAVTTTPAQTTAIAAG